MKKNKVIEAWRNEEYFLSLSEEERAGLPAHPSGLVGVEDEILRSVTGGCGAYGTDKTPCLTFCGGVYCF